MTPRSPLAFPINYRVGACVITDASGRLPGILRRLESRFDICLVFLQIHIAFEDIPENTFICIAGAGRSSALGNAIRIFIQRQDHPAIHP
jgi:hypothetical protein